MGVDRTDYLMFGVKLDYDAVDHDKHEAMIEGRPDAPFTLIVDGMGGKYAVAGKIVVSADKWDGIEFTEVTDEMLVEPPGMAQTISESFGVPVDKLRLMFFSHYS